ncbi:RagB/SusD family nutrient uptake outer membrane protein [Chitinophaga sp.]|uniref:RagB/SusD family nutrient uptake outer membrane protein n=1 Tax=Chitinophaga sp. TaxID=1869181 RepID=UPI0031D3DE51
MKNNILAILLKAAMPLLLLACKHELTESPQSLMAETFYNTKAEVESAVFAIYLPLRPNTMPNYYATLECQSDYGYGRGSWAQMNEYQGFNDVNTNRINPFWADFYVSIRNANFVIRNTPNGNAISEAEKAMYIGEARFLRAFDYFHLVRNWGGVPLRTEENLDVTDIPRSSKEDVYALILADLAYAETNLPDVAAQSGRPSKWTAKTLLADVYLELGRFAEARDKADEAIKSGKYALVPVSSTADYQKIYGPEVITTKEEIFYFKYSRQVEQGNYMLWITNHPSTGLFKAGGAYAIYSETTNPVYAGWNNADFRKGMWTKINIGLGPNSLVSSKYQDPQAISQRGAGTDLPVYRYSELLLMYAEAACRAGNAPTAEAMEALNKVHRRAYGYNPEAPSAVDFKLADYDAQSFVDLVMKERGYEFQFEGKRWLELKRSGRAKEIIKAVKNITVADKNMLWPIPLSEMNYNKALDPAKDQNPGY